MAMIDSHMPSLEAATRDLIIVGAGGLAPEAAWVAEEMNNAALQSGHPRPWNILGFCVYDPTLYPAEIFSYRVLGTPNYVAQLHGDKQLFYIAAIGDNRIREKESAGAEALGWKAATLIHPSVRVARNVSIGPGTYIAAGAVASPTAKIGAHVLINNHVSVGHDSVMGDFSQACPGSRISGHCTIGRSAFLGSNATVAPGVTIGEGSIVGANSLVIRPLQKGVTAVGVPVRILTTESLPVETRFSKSVEDLSD